VQLTKQLVLLLILAVCAAACTAGRAQDIEEAPTLVVPPVPPRAIEPAASTEPMPVLPVVDNIAPPAPAPTKPRNTAQKTEAKPEPKPETPPETANATVPNPPPVEPLRTPTTPSGPEAEKQIRDVLNTADVMLGRVDYQKLTADRRATYDSAKNFMQQAEGALKKEDLTQARLFANRALNIAKVLEGR